MQPSSRPQTSAAPSAARLQQRYTEASAILRRLGGNEQTLDGFYWELLSRMGLPYRTVSVMTNGLCNLDISAKGVDDLAILRGFPLGALNARHNPIESIAPLAGLPLERLDISETLVRDLAPLKDMPLIELSIRDTPVRDLAPLHGLPLRRLDISGTQASDLSPLKDMQLEALDISRTPVEDLSPLATVPLRSLRAEECPKARDWSPVSRLLPTRRAEEAAAE